MALNLELLTKAIDEVDFWWRKSPKDDEKTNAIKHTRTVGWVYQAMMEKRSQEAG